MNVYDFDKTIYNGDSTVDFFLYAIKRKPYLLIYVPKQAWGFFLYAIKKIDKTQLKEYFFCFCRLINAEELAVSFWKKNQRKIYSWYLHRQQSDDIIISASPQFLLKPVCQNLGIKHLIASVVDPKTGRFNSKNCYGYEKTRRLNEEFGNISIESFYSDSLSDLPLAKMATNAFIIEKGKIKKWAVSDNNG